MSDKPMDAKTELEEGAPQDELKKIVVSDAAATFVARGGHIFAGQVIDIDAKIKPGEEILVLDSKGHPLTHGWATESTLQYIPEKALQEMPKKIVVSDAAAVFIARGGHIFARQIVEADPDISRGDWVLVVDRRDRPLTTAYAAKSAKELTGGGRSETAALA